MSGGRSPAPNQLLFVNARQVVTCAGPARARRGREMNDAGIRERTGILVEGERIAALGDEAELRASARNPTVIDCGGIVPRNDFPHAR